MATFLDVNLKKTSKYTYTNNLILVRLSKSIKRGKIIQNYNTRNGNGYRNCLGNSAVNKLSRQDLFRLRKQHLSELPYTRTIQANNVVGRRR